MGPARFLNGLSITGDLTVTGNILPGASNTYDIGSTSSKWRNGYFQRLGINLTTGDIDTTYVLDVRGKAYFESDILANGSLTVNSTTTLKTATTIGTTTANNNNLLTVNGHIVVNPSYNANNSYSEGIRINKDSNNWSVIALGGAAGSITGTSSAVWLIGANSANNFFISNNGSDSATNRFQGTPTEGFRIYASAACAKTSSNVQTQKGTLTIGSTPDAYNSSTSGGDAAIELWRGKNASWIILNTGGILQFKNNYTSAAQSTYNQNALDLNYNHGDSIIYSNFKPGELTNGLSNYTLGLNTANWYQVNTKTLNFAYDSTDQYLTHAGVADVASHSGKITLYRLLASGTSGTKASGNKLRPGVVLDAATGLISLESASTNPSTTAGSRIEFKFYDSDSSLGQPVYLSHSVNDGYRAPYGLKVWSNTNTAPYAWFEVEGSLYIGTHSSATSSSDVNTKRSATSLYIGTKVAVSGYDTWLRLNDLTHFTKGVYTPHEFRSGRALAVIADTVDSTNSANRASATFYTGYDTSATATATYINTTKTVIANKVSINSEDASSDTNKLWVDGWSKFNGDLLPNTTNNSNLGKGGTSGQKRWKALFIGTADSYGSGTQPIYWDSGVPKATTYSLSATVNSSTANYLAYYSGANAISGKSGSGAIYTTSSGGAITFGTLPIAQGGTGLTSSPSMLINLSSTTAANVLQASPRPGVTGTLLVSNGGTGMTTTTYVNAVVIGNSSNATNAMQTVATANGAFYATASNAKPTFGTLPVAQGGTGKVSWTQWGVLYASAGTTLANTAAGTSGYPLIGQGSAAPVWYGGIAFTGTAAASWVTTIKGTTDSTSSSTGAVIINGGVGIAKSIFNASNFSFGTSGLGRIYSGNDYTLSGSATTLTSDNIATYFEEQAVDATYPWAYDATNAYWHINAVTQDIHNINNVVAIQWKALSTFALILDYMIHSEGNCDYLRVWVNDVEKFAKSGNNQTGTGIVYLKTNDIVKIVFRKDSSANPTGEYYRAVLKRQSYSNVSVVQVEKNLVPTTTNSQQLGSSTLKWSKAYIGTEDTYGSTSQPIYWNNGVPAPCDLNLSDSKVKQTATTTNAVYEILFSETADNTTRTEGARKTSTLTYNPSTKELVSNGPFSIGNSTVGRIYNGNDYTLSGSSTIITTDNIATYFTVNSTDATYPWVYDATNAYWHLNATTLGTHNINNVVMCEWKALSNFALLVEASIRSEHNFDYFEILVNGSSKFTTKGGSGTGDWSVAGVVYLKTNDIVTFRFKKDGSGEPSDVEYYRAVLKRQSYSNVVAVQVEKDLLPTTTNSQKLGSTNLKWSAIYGEKVYGAVWNDYAEYRQVNEELGPGRVVIETGNGNMKLSEHRLQPGANIITDTFGFAIGETDKNKTPIAVSGRVLAYPFEPIEEFRKHIGGPVCSGPVGTVSIMNTNEERLYPSRIIGTVSEIPDYETWGTENIKVDGRIWIRIR